MKITDGNEAQINKTLDGTIIVGVSGTGTVDFGYYDDDGVFNTLVDGSGITPGSQLQIDAGRMAVYAKVSGGTINLTVYGKD